jgi:hypothetical protein
MSTAQKPAVRRKQMARRTKKLAQWRAKKAAAAAQTTAQG